MTDEKRMVEEYLKDDSKWLIEDCEGNLINITKKVKEAFLAGLKADSPKWHILAEEPNILPKEGQKVRVLTEEGIIEESTLFYDTYYEELSWSNIGLLKVFAWCEIPKFSE